MHHKEDYKADFAISKHYHGSYHMGKGEDSPNGLPMMPRDYPISAQTMTQSKAHIPGPSVGIS